MPESGSLQTAHARGDCPEKPSAQGDEDVCWSLDSRKTVHSSPPDFSGSWPSFPLVSIYLDVLPREWGPHSVPVCPLGNLGYLGRGYKAVLSPTQLGPQCLQWQAHRLLQSGQLWEGRGKRCQPTWGGNLSLSEACASAISSTAKPVHR